MQATDCRRAFPCWDEPDFKAVFAHHAVIDPALTAVSNGPEIGRETTRPDGKVRGPLRRHDGDEHLPGRVRRRSAGGHRAGRRRRHRRCASYHVPGKGHLTGFALDIGAFALRWFQDYYGIPYPSDKVDLLALPDFAAGAMENLGCITFRESLLLVDPATSTHSRAAGRRRRRRPRARPHVVRRPRHDALVERHLAQRGVRHVHGDRRVRRVPPGLGALDDVRPRALGGLRGRLAASRPARSSSRCARRPTPTACSTCSRTRRAARCCACSSSTSAPSASARASATTSASTPTATPRRATCGTRSRRRTGAAGAAACMDSWIWQPGYPLVSAASTATSSSSRQQRFAFGDTDDIDDAGSCRCIVRNGGDHRAGPARRRRRPACPLADPTAPSSSTPAATASTASPTRRELRERLSGAALGRLDTLERYNLVDDAWAAVIAGRLTGA